VRFLVDDDNDDDDDDNNNNNNNNNKQLYSIDPFWLNNATGYRTWQST
jgi:hypothetical protein